MNTTGRGQTTAACLCVLLACFDGRRGAARARGDLRHRLQSDDAVVIDDVILSVDDKRRGHVHDPHRVIAGVVTPAITWGAFGLLAGGDVRGLVVWGVLGAICGGLYAYALEHILTKDDLAGIGAHLPQDSSAVMAFVEAENQDTVLGVAWPDATVTSAVAIEPDLTSHAMTGSTTPGTSEGPVLSMSLLRFDGEHTARHAVASMTTDEARPELVIEVSKEGRTRVVSPTQGVAAMSKSDVVSWGGFGVVFGLIAGLAGSGGIFDAIEQGVVEGLAWAVFGLVAGALYGLWAGRATSARRIKRLRPLLPPDTSTAVVWVAGPPTATIADNARSAAGHITLCFLPSGPGAVLQTA